MLFGDVLKDFKDREEEWVENITPLAEDAGLRNALLAWKSVAVSFKDSQECPHEDDATRWKWLWEQVTYDQASFASVAGCKPQDAGPLLTRLIGLRLVYPDGSINGFARNLLQSIIMAKIQGKRGAGRPKKDDKKS